MEQYENNYDDIQALINVLPLKIAEVINENGNLDKLIEVVMDVGRIPLARYTSGDFPLSAEALLLPVCITTPLSRKNARSR